ITPCCVSTHSQSRSWGAMISAENELGIESQPPSAGLSCCHNRFTAFSRIPFPPGCCLSDCSPLSRPRPAVNAAPGGRRRPWYPFAQKRPLPAPEAIERVAEVLAAAQSPLIVCGDGVATSGAVPELVRLAEALGARVHASFCAELPFPSDHPLYAGLVNVISEPALKGQFSAADVIFAIGRPLLTLP